VAAVFFVLALSATPTALRADGTVPPGGNGITCQNWDPVTGQKVCDIMCDNAPACGVGTCKNNGFLPCNICNCKLFTYPNGVKNCECLD